jgi:hypothetical protein
MKAATRIVRSWVLAFLLTLTAAALLPSSPALAKCNFEDMVGAFKLAVSTTAECQKPCEDQYECYAVAVLAAALTFDVKQGVDVSPICTDMPAKVEDLMAKLSPFLSQEDMADMSQYASYITDALQFVKCACMTKDLNIANESSFGQCITDVAEAVGCKPIVVAGFIVAYDCIPGNPASQAFDAIKGWTCKNLELGCGDHDYVEANYKFDCPSGMQSDRNGTCVPCSSIANATTGNNGECVCKSGYTEDAFWLYVPGYSDAKYKFLQSCTFSCSAPFVYSGGFCQCPFGTQSDYGGGCRACAASERYVPFKVTGGVLTEGRCESCPICTTPSANLLSCSTPCDNNKGEIFQGGKCIACPSNSRAAYFSGSCGQCEACQVGQKVSANHQACIPACPPGQIMGGLMIGKDPASDPTAYQCQSCPDNTYPSYEKAGSSKGACLVCPDGTYSKTGATQCFALNCAPGSYQDPDNAHACKSCPATQIYIPTEKKVVPGPGGKSTVQIVAGHCGCGDNQVMQNGVCACAAGATKIQLPGAPGSVFACACPAGAHFDAATGSCKCAAGATLDAAKNACFCPIGQHLVGDECLSVGLSPAPLQPKDCSGLGPNYINNPKNPSVCLRCPAGRVANAERNACVVRGRPAPAAAPPPVGRPPLQCRPGTVPNAAGTACIRRLAPQRAAPPPGIRRPGARDAAPARPARRPPGMRE